MKTHSICALAFAAVLAIASPAQAILVGAYEFDGSTPAPSSVAAGLAFSDFDLSIKTVQYFPGSPGEAIGGTGWATQGNSFVFSITVDPGQFFSFDTLTFDEQRASDGPLDWEVFVNNVSQGTGTGDFPLNSESVSVGLTELTGTIDVSIVGTNAGSDGGSWRLDNVQVFGSVAAIPEPSAALFGVLLTSGLALSIARRQSNS